MSAICVVPANYASINMWNEHEGSEDAGPTTKIFDKMADENVAKDST